jgi:hypothetical protein
MKLIPMLALSALLVVACKKEESASTEDVTTEAVSTAETTETATEAEGVPTQEANVPAPAAASTKAVALNPPHGQPGHKCEIPVGAPLDGSGGKTPVPTANQPQSSGSLPSNSFFAQKPSGQAAASTPAATPAPQPTAQPVAQPAAQPMPQPVAQKTEPGFSGKPNPAHGQPGHRCDIKVGETLP